MGGFIVGQMLNCQLYCTVLNGCPHTFAYIWYVYLLCSVLWSNECAHSFDFDLVSTHFWPRTMFVLWMVVHKYLDIWLGVCGQWWVSFTSWLTAIKAWSISSCRYGNLPVCLLARPPGFTHKTRVLQCEDVAVFNEVSKPGRWCDRSVQMWRRSETSQTTDLCVLCVVCTRQQCSCSYLCASDWNYLNWADRKLPLLQCAHTHTHTHPPSTHTHTYSWHDSTLDSPLI